MNENPVMLVLVRAVQRKELTAAIERQTLIDIPNAKATNRSRRIWRLNTEEKASLLRNKTKRFALVDVQERRDIGGIVACFEQVIGNSLPIAVIEDGVVSSTVRHHAASVELRCLT